MHSVVVTFLIGLDRSGASPQSHSPLTHLPGHGLDSLLPARLDSDIYRADGAPSCPLDYRQLKGLFGWFRPTLFVGSTGDRFGSLIYYANNVTVQIGKPAFDGGLMRKMKAQFREWDQAEKLGVRATYVFRLLELFMFYYNATKVYLLEEHSTKLTHTHIQLYNPDYQGNAHLDQRLWKSTRRLLVPARGDEARPLAYYVGNWKSGGFDLRNARLLALATGAIMMTDVGAGGSALLPAGVVGLGHARDDANAAEVRIAHAPYPLGRTAPSRGAATVVFSGKYVGMDLG